MFIAEVNGWGPQDTGKACVGKKLTDYTPMIVGKTHPEVCDPWKKNASATASAAALDLTEASTAPLFDTYRGSFGTVRIPRDEPPAE